LILKIPYSRNPEGCLATKPVHIGKNCKISQDSQVGPYAVLGDNCYLYPGAVVKNSVLWPGTTIKNGCTVENSIIGAGATINKNVKDDLLAQDY
jgi:Nucleoside-diphosphate-sugar pyrophosphorylase involved in lipopolysaccharide biosynthesis/translation initiation factor 2B, gamma/epsilon subunits (eIF-2Bgamma/eIF-2Bepsilon)